MGNNKKNRSVLSSKDKKNKKEDPLGFYVGKGASKFGNFLQKYD